MDGFDDLLAPSRAALESNPFEDPFGKRSSSPDPWASFNPSSSALHDDHSPFGTHGSSALLDSTAVFSDQPSLGYTSYESSAPSLAEPETPLGLSSSVDIAAVHDEPEPKTPTDHDQYPSRSPGFRESISTTAEEPINPPLVPEREPTPPPPSTLPPLPPPPSVPDTPVSPTLTDPFSQPTPVVAPEPQPTMIVTRAPTPPPTQKPSLSPAPPPAPASAPAETRARSFFSPLEQPSSSLERSFAGLAIGGEAFNDGWGGSGTQSVFVGASTPAQIQDEDSDEDDKPIAQTRAGLQAASVPSSPPATKTTSTNDTGIAPVFAITVDDPQRVGDPIRAYTMYTVHTKTTSPLYSKSSFSVLRRYSDFLWLYETLSANNPGVVVPPVPEKASFGRFDATFVQQRRLALEKCIQKIANHPVLQKDSDLKLFLEHDNFALEIKHRKAALALDKGGLMASIGAVVTGPRFHETDEWFDKQKGYLDSLEVQLKGLVKTIELVSKQRQELAAATGEFSQAIAELAASEEGLGQQLAGALAGLAAVEKKAQELQEKQSNEDMITMMSTADEYARLISSVRLAFSSRIRVYHAWQNADSNVKRVKQTHESNRAQGKIPSERLGHSLSLVADAERRALDAKQEFDHVSRLVKSEVARFERERIEDFKNSLEAFLDGMISKQKELIDAWENFQHNLLKKPPGRAPAAGAEAAAETPVEVS